MSTVLSITPNFPISNFLSKLNPYHELEIRIHTIALSRLQDNLTEQQYKDLQQGFKLGRSWIWQGRIGRQLSLLSEDTIKAFLLQVMESSGEGEIEYYFQCCMKYLTEQSLLAMGGFSHINGVLEDFKVRALTKSTFLKSHFEKESQVIWNEFLIEFKHFVHQVLEVLVCLTGINEITRQKHREYRETTLSSTEANSRIEMYLKLIGYPAALFGIVYSYVEFKVTAVFLTFILCMGTISALVAYNRYWKPCPIDHSGLKNLSIELLREMKPIYARRDILGKIEAAFQAKKGVILVGEPGAGKSWIVRSFVEQALAGRICTFIKNPQIFSCNASSLLDIGPNICSLVSVEERFKNHRDQVVFFLDEFHTLFDGKSKLVGDSIGQQIKTFCEDFKYVIGATTTEEFNSYIANQKAIVDRRFTIVHVPPMEHDELKIALSQHLASESMKIDFSPDIFDYIIDNAQKFNSKTSITDASFSLLDSAIQKMNADSRRDLQENLFHLENQLSSLEQIVISGGLEKNPEKVKGLVAELNEKKKEIETVKLEIDQKNAKAKRIHEMESYFRKLQRHTYYLADLNVDLTKNAKLKADWLKLRIKINLVLAFIAKENADLKRPLILDKALIDNILTTHDKVKVFHDEQKSQS